MAKYKKILVAFDASASSRNALIEAFRLASDEKCWITVVSVAPAYQGDLDLIAVRDVAAALRKPCEDALREAERMAEQERALIKTVCDEGEPHSRIVDLADAENADIIVMGRRGKRDVDRMMVGSITARVIGHSSRDVLVVPEDGTVGWKKILVSTDGSKYSTAATDRAIAFAASYGGELLVLSVVDVPAEFYAEAPKAVEDLIRQAKQYVRDVQDRAAAAGVEAETFIAEGEAFEAIVKLAREQGVNMIVMGSHGRTGIRRLLMGSVTEKVIGHAPCSVLVGRV